jgi:hypothetical protein
VDVELQELSDRIDAAIRDSDRREQERRLAFVRGLHSAEEAFSTAVHEAAHVVAGIRYLNGAASAHARGPEGLVQWLHIEHHHWARIMGSLAGYQAERYLHGVAQDWDWNTVGQARYVASQLTGNEALIHDLPRVFYILKAVGRDADDWFQRYVDITANFIEHDWDSILELANRLYERCLDSEEIQNWWEERPRKAPMLIPGDVLTIDLPEPEPWPFPELHPEPTPAVMAGAARVAPVAATLAFVSIAWLMLTQ